MTLVLLPLKYEIDGSVTVTVVLLEEAYIPEFTPLLGYNMREVLQKPRRVFWFVSELVSPHRDKPVSCHVTRVSGRDSWLSSADWSGAAVQYASLTSR